MQFHGFLKLIITGRRLQHRTSVGNCVDNIVSESCVVLKDTGQIGRQCITPPCQNFDPGSDCSPPPHLPCRSHCSCVTLGSSVSCSRVGFYVHAVIFILPLLIQPYKASQGFHFSLSAPHYSFSHSPNSRSHGLELFFCLFVSDRIPHR